MGFCNCSMFCCTFLYVPSSFAIIFMGKRELVALLSLSFWCLVIVVWLFLVVPWVSPQFVIVVFPDYTHLLFLKTLPITLLTLLYNHPFNQKSLTSWLLFVMFILVLLLPHVVSGVRCGT